LIDCYDNGHHSPWNVRVAQIKRMTRTFAVIFTLLQKFCQYHKLKDTWFTMMKQTSSGKKSQFSLTSAKQFLKNIGNL